MNQNIIALADAVARAFEETITNGKTNKSALLIPTVGEGAFKIPDSKFDKKGWEEFLNALKFRHKIEAFYIPTQNQVLVCPFGWLSDAPMITDAEVDATIRDFKVAGEVANEQYRQLMARLKK